MYIVPANRMTCESAWCGVCVVIKRAWAICRERGERARERRNGGREGEGGRERSESKGRK